MKTNNLLILLFGMLSSIGFSYADSSPKILGYKTAQEIESETIARNRLLPNYSQQEEKRLLEVWKKYVPSYVKFIQTESPVKNIQVGDLKPIKNNDLPSKQMLPINGIVLNQSAYETCSTFALMGAIQQSLIMNDQPINFATSPSCTLQMETTAMGGPGNVWNGSWPHELAPLIQQYGIIDENTGGTGFCNSRYPTYSSPGIINSALSIPLNTYSNSSFHAGTQGNVDYPAAYFSISSSFSSPQQALNNIKQYLNYGGVYSRSGQSVTYIMPYWTVLSFHVNMNGIYSEVVGGTSYPTFIKTNDAPQSAGHSIYAFGYDDNICLSTPFGQQCGILYLRNSWGDTGTNGIYLMTYDYYLQNYYQTPMIGITDLSTVQAN